MSEPRVIRTISDMQATSDNLRGEGRRIGLVPTMGYLHAGHTTLIQQASRLTSDVVVSLFVNPTQFGQNEDFSSYPRDFDSDVRLIGAAGGRTVFAPEPDEMYPDGFVTSVKIDRLSDHLCGASRPGHFEGVATVVTKLFSAVKPHFAVFGQKDAQQLGIIRKMVQDLNIDVDILGAPTVREADGLAKSSRNTYLNPKERQAATVIFQALQKGRDLVCRGEKDVKHVVSTMEDLVLAKPLAEVEYISAVDPGDFQPVDQISGKVLIAMAVRFGKARLIDNLMVKEPDESKSENTV